MRKKKITDVTGVENCNASVFKYMSDSCMMHLNRAGLDLPVLSAITMCIFLWKNKKHSSAFETFAINNQESTLSDGQ